MNKQKTINYHRIAHAIEYIKNNFKQQPNLDDIAKQVHLSPFHFQRLFKEWAGTTPKKFLQYISIEHAKELLSEKKRNLFDVAFDIGLSSTGRLHDLFIKIEGMTPLEYKNGGKNLTIDYNFFTSPFGNLIIASTSKGICYMAFEENKDIGIYNLKKKFPNAVFKEQTNHIQQNAISIFNHDKNTLPEIKLHLKGTDFQLKVWDALLKIPKGELSTYSNISTNIGMPKAFRAVGTAIGSNPVAFLIPCHRVIQSNGQIGGYMWGNIRKTAIIGWESSQVYSEI